MSKGEETRRTVLGAAISLASRLGLEGVTIGRLAEEVGLSKSGLFAHFRSKEQLQEDLIAEARARFVALVISPALAERRGEPRVRALFDKWLAWGKSDAMPGGCIFVTASVELDDRPGPVRDRLVATQKDWLDTLAGAARIAIEEHHFRTDLDPNLFAHEVYTLVIGHYFVARLLADPRAEKRTRAAFDRLLADARAPSRTRGH